MKVNFAFVQPGGGETDYGLSFDMDELPRPGDYISISRDDSGRMEDFVVRRVHWGLKTDQENTFGKVDVVCIECEFAEGPFSSDDHKRTVDSYERKTGVRLKFDISVY